MPAPATTTRRPAAARASRASAAAPSSCRNWRRSSRKFALRIAHRPAARTSCRGSSAGRRRAARGWRGHRPAGRTVPTARTGARARARARATGSSAASSMPRMTWPSVIARQGSAMRFGPSSVPTRPPATSSTPATRCARAPSRIMAPPITRPMRLLGLAQAYERSVRVTRFYSRIARILSAIARPSRRWASALRCNPSTPSAGVMRPASRNSAPAARATAS